MKSVFLRLWHRGIAVGLLACSMQSAAAQTPAFTQATACGDGLTSNSYALAEAITADPQGNTYVAGQFTGTVRFGSITLVGYYNAFVAKRNATGTWLWVVSGGGGGNAKCTDVTLDAQGQVYVTGAFSDGAGSVPIPATFGATALTSAGGPDVLVAKLDGNTGAWLWAQQAGFGNAYSGTDLGRAVVPDGAGGLLVAGTFDGPIIRIGPNTLYNVGRGTDLFVARLDAATGAWGWAVSTGHGTVQDLVADAQGNAYLTGEFGSAIAFGPFQLVQARGGYLAKISRAGAWQWASAFTATPGTGSFPGGIGGIGCKGLAVDNRGHLYACGGFNGATARFDAVTLTNASGTFQGNTAPGSIQNSDAFVARLSTATGSWQWAVRAGGVDGEYLTDLAVRGSRVYAAGIFGRGSGLDPGTPSANGSVFGTTAVVSAGKYDAVVAALDTAGGWQWAVQAGGVEQEEVRGIALDAGNRLHLIGTFEGASAQFGGMTVAGSAFSSYYTGFLAQLAGGPLAALPTAASTSFALYPNPARAVVTVTGLAPNERLQVLDVLGRCVALGQMPPQGSLQLLLPVSLSPGVYLVRAGSQIRRLLVE